MSSSLFFQLPFGDLVVGDKFLGNYTSMCISDVSADTPMTKTQMMYLSCSDKGACRSTKPSGQSSYWYTNDAPVTVVGGPTFDILSKLHPILTEKVHITSLKPNDKFIYTYVDGRAIEQSVAACSTDSLRVVTSKEGLFWSESAMVKLIGGPSFEAAAEKAKKLVPAVHTFMANGTVKDADLQLNDQFTMAASDLSRMCIGRPESTTFKVTSAESQHATALNNGGGGFCYVTKPAVTAMVTLVDGPTKAILDQFTKIDPKKEEPMLDVKKPECVPSGCSAAASASPKSDIFSRAASSEASATPTHAALDAKIADLTAKVNVLTEQVLHLDKQHHSDIANLDAGLTAVQGHSNTLADRLRCVDTQIDEINSAASELADDLNNHTNSYHAAEVVYDDDFEDKADGNDTEALPEISLDFSREALREARGCPYEYPPVYDTVQADKPARSGIGHFLDTVLLIKR